MTEAGADLAPAATLQVREVETPPDHRSKEQQVADLLTGQSSPPEADPETGSSDDAPPAEKWDLKALAERLAVDPAKLYELNVPLEGGRSMSLGALKDAIKAQDAADAERQTFVQERGSWQADQIRSRRELEQLLAVLPEQARAPELIQTVTRQMQELVSREQEALFRKVPEWVDSKVLQADRKVMEQHLASHGFQAAELDQITDHRLLAYFRSQALKEKQLKAATEPRPVGPKAGIGRKGGAPVSRAQDVGRIKAAVTNRQISPVAGIERILKGI